MLSTRSITKTSRLYEVLFQDGLDESGIPLGLLFGSQRMRSQKFLQHGRQRGDPNGCREPKGTNVLAQPLE